MKAPPLSHQLNVRLGDGATHGRIRTRFDEPFMGTTQRYDVVIRYLDEKGLPCRYTLFVHGVACGDTWVSTGDGRGWTSYTVRGVEIPAGGEIRVDADSAAGRLDYVLLNAVEP